MSGFIGRSFMLFSLLATLIFSLLTFLLGWPSYETWLPLWTFEEANLPIAIWLAISLLGISMGVAISSTQLAKKKERAIDAYLQSVLTADKQSNDISVPAVSTKLKKLLSEVTMLIATQKKSLLKMSDERAEGEDKRIQERIIQERQRLARELHDSVSQQLFAASMLLSAITEQQESDNQEIPKPLAQAEKIVQQAQLEMRALLLHLRPAALHNKSLTQGLEELLFELQQKVHFTIRFRLEDVSLSKGVEDHLFRIAQETLSNTLRHANASEVDILFVERDGLAIFRVQDNGIGFMKDEGNAGSYGLHHIQERAIEMGGTSKIVSVPSQGTIVEVKVPVEKGVEVDDTNRSSG
ncbi:sensor histidine kinase [Paenisporosarcina sp. OV554]|uniref:sensor histidine kinase n=1 Tax=Paenisporosarcina sp. OV554 TaxID=2135694 RepID=UPI000D3DAF8D|nr:sensor histidine kinase [Paenisporosarcina sp. OV554]PUB16791.1 two-component system vancomycin resistance sensor histidine kinase VraS [Paenisporosarcina sp. OV554]